MITPGFRLRRRPLPLEPVPVASEQPQVQETIDTERLGPCVQPHGRREWRRTDVGPLYGEEASVVGLMRPARMARHLVGCVPILFKARSGTRRPRIREIRSRPTGNWSPRMGLTASNITLLGPVDSVIHSGP